MRLFEPLNSPSRITTAGLLLIVLSSLVVPVRVPARAWADTTAPDANECGLSNERDIEEEIEGQDAAEARSEAIDEAQSGPQTISREEYERLRQEFEQQVKPEYWKNKAATNPGNYSAEDLVKMRGGKGPKGSDGYTVELHHKQPLASGGSNDPSNLEEMTRTEHRLGENNRKNHPGRGCPGIFPPHQTTDERCVAE